MKHLAKILGVMSALALAFTLTVSTAIAASQVKPLVSTQWVAENMKSIKILDVSKKEYAEGHIPGAVQIKWGGEVFDPGTDHMVLGLAEIERVIGRMGITPDDHVVLYDGFDKPHAHYVTRVYWTLKYWNFPKVSIMDGGIILWKKEGRPLNTKTTTPSRTNAEVNFPPNTKIRAMFSPDIIHALATGKSVILDARHASFFNGEVYSLNKWVRSGHIPGAKNVFTLDAMNGNNMYKPVADLQTLFEQGGITPDKKIITYCDTGVLATHAWFVLHELLGYTNVKVYDGSMREYANRFDVPMEPGVVGGQFPMTPIQELQEKIK